MLKTYLINILWRLFWWLCEGPLRGCLQMFLQLLQIQKVPSVTSHQIFFQCFSASEQRRQHGGHKAWTSSTTPQEIDPTPSREGNKNTSKSVQGCSAKRRLDRAKKNPKKTKKRELRGAAAQTCGSRSSNQTGRYNADRQRGKDAGERRPAISADWLRLRNHPRPSWQEPKLGPAAVRTTRLISAVRVCVFLCVCVCVCAVS